MFILNMVQTYPVILTSVLSKEETLAVITDNEILAQGKDEQELGRNYAQKVHNYPNKTFVLSFECPFKLFSPYHSQSKPHKQPRQSYEVRNIRAGRRRSFRTGFVDHSRVLEGKL